MSGLVRLRNFQRLASRLAQVSKAQNVPVTQSVIRRLLSTPSPQKSEEENKPKKYWMFYGFDDTSEYLDRHILHVTMFLSISCVLTFGTYVLIYLPDFRMKDWAWREAFLELRRREQNGLPLIDPNLIDPSKVQLPTDEELGDTEVII